MNGTSSYEEDHPVRECYMSLGFKADDLVPSEIDGLLNVAATDSWVKGQGYASKSGQVLVKPSGLWRFSTETNPSKSLQVHADLLLATFESKEHVIRKIIDETDIEVIVSAVWRTHRDTRTGFSLNARTLARISALCREFYVYFM